MQVRRDQGNVLSGAAHGPVVQAATVRDVHFHGPRERAVIPFQLPPASGLFAGRYDELAELDHWRADDHPLLVVISGPGGVGKTSLALRWLHDTREHFPDGQLYVDLDAHGSTGPATPDEVLEWFLLALGVDAARMPLGLARRQALFRSMTAGRAFAVLLDNAASAAQVRPLLAAGTVVVTSRWRLSGLAMDGARFVEVDPMDVPASVAVLERAVGGRRLTAEPAAARELATLCGGLPIALSVVGARLSTHPRRSLAKEVGALRVADDRLSTLALADTASVEAVLDLSYVELPFRQARVYRLCALHPGATFGIEVAAAAVDEPVPDVEDALDDLVEKNLVTEVSDDRFRFHDLLRLHARRQAESDTKLEREAAVHRMIDWYLDRAVAADLVVLPLRPRVGPRYAVDQPSPFADRAEALAWLEDERGNLVNAVRAAAERNWHAHVWQLCEAMWGLFLFRHHYPDWMETHVLGVAAARQLGDRTAEARIRIQLGFAYAAVGRSYDAIGEFTGALRTAEAIGDDGSRATALRQLAKIARARGDLDTALAHLRHSLGLERSLGRQRGEGLAHRRIGELLTEAGRYDEAVAEFEQGEAILSALDDALGVARLRMFLAEAHLKADRVAQAQSLLDDALTVMTDASSPSYLADVHVLLAEVAQRQGDPARARAHCVAAQEAYAGTGEPVPARITTMLAALPR
jgi:tetratricopeptide (TPR) repeat protein